MGLFMFAGYMLAGFFGMLGGGLAGLYIDWRNAKKADKETTGDKTSGRPKPPATIDYWDVPSRFARHGLTPAWLDRWVIVFLAVTFSYSAAVYFGDQYVPTVTQAWLAATSFVVDLVAPAYPAIGVYTERLADHGLADRIAVARHAYAINFLIGIVASILFARRISVTRAFLKKRIYNAEGSCNEAVMSHALVMLLIFAVVVLFEIAFWNGSYLDDPYNYERDGVKDLFIPSLMIPGGVIALFFVVCIGTSLKLNRRQPTLPL